MCTRTRNVNKNLIFYEKCTCRAQSNCGYTRDVRVCQFFPLNDDMIVYACCADLLQINIFFATWVHAYRWMYRPISTPPLIYKEERKIRVEKCSQFQSAFFCRTHLLVVYICVHLNCARLRQVCGINYIGRNSDLILRTRPQ